MAARSSEALSKSAASSSVVGGFEKPERSGRDEIAGGRFARAGIRQDVEANLLALLQVAHSGALDRADMDEHVLAAVVGLDEAEALLRIKPLYCTNLHSRSLSREMREFASSREMRERASAARRSVCLIDVEEEVS
jgi:hypothetical protein